MPFEKVAEKTLADVLELFLTKRRTRNIDLTMELTIAGTKIGSLRIVGKIEHIPGEEKA